MTTMKALTFWRPWTDAIVHGPKRVENRTWRPPESMLGQQIAIHAGQRYEVGDWPWPGDYDPPSKAKSPTGIVGVARILGYLSIGPDGRRVRSLALSVTTPEAHAKIRAQLEQLDGDPWWSGPCGWLLGEVVAIEPVPCLGARQLWEVPQAMATLVRSRALEARRARR